MEKILSDGFAALGITPDAEAVGRLQAYYEYLEERNKVMNLTAISGAGFPGLVLKIVQPEMDITLLDSLNKRIDFLGEMSEKLELERICCVHARAEEIPEERRAAYDIAVSRAVAHLGTLCELCLPYLRVGGRFIAMKGPDCADEVAEAENAMHLLGARLEKIEHYAIPGTDITHAAVVIEKIKPTHPKYPRKWAQIKKNPL